MLAPSSIAHCCTTHGGGPPAQACCDGSHIERHRLSAKRRVVQDFPPSPLSDSNRRPLLTMVPPGAQLPVVTGDSVRLGEVRWGHICLTRDTAGDMSATPGQAAGRSQKRHVGRRLREDTFNAQLWPSRRVLRCDAAEAVHRDRCHRDRFGSGCRAVDGRQRGRTLAGRVSRRAAPLREGDLQRRGKPIGSSISTGRSSSGIKQESRS